MDALDHVDRIRDFNRYYTRRLGVLTDRYLGQDRPLGEARLLYEIGDGTTVRELRARLGLDSGHLSRLLRSLEDDGLVRTRPHPDDGRVRVARLTAAGVRERDELDARSRAGIDDWLRSLTPAQRDRLVAAQAEVRRLLRLAAVTVTAVPDDAAEARRCLAAYAAELAGRFPEGYAESALLRPGELAGRPGSPDGRSAVPTALPGAPVYPPGEGASLPGAPPPSGEFLLAREEDEPVGCGVWQRLAPGVAEIRHVWVAPAARGLGLGRRLLGALESAAAAHGHRTVRLGTHAVLTEAIALYRGSGYREIPPYDESPYNQIAFEKTL
jgi:DNA-binding MarR family transcriptional regulator/ribosomal protein S18 acetylase RimI-like enzyme